MEYEALRDVEQKVSSNIYNNVVARLHFHRSIELVYALEGALRARVGANSFVVEKDEILFVPSYFAHSISPIGETKSITFIIPYNYFDIFIKQNCELYFFVLNNKEVNKQIKLMIDFASQETLKQPNILLQGYINVILGLILKNYQVVPHEKGSNNLMIEIIEYIDKNYKEEISLEKISEHFKYNKFYFSRLFNRCFGCNLNYYVNQVRLNSVLSNTDNDKKMSAAILDAGFNDLSTYYKVKKRN